MCRVEKSSAVNLHTEMRVAPSCALRLALELAERLRSHAAGERLPADESARAEVLSTSLYIVYIRAIFTIYSVYTGDKGHLRAPQVPGEEAARH